MPRHARSMPRSADLGARFTQEERLRVERARMMRGQNLSEFIRSAVLASAQETLATDPLAPFSDAIGVLDVPGAFGREGAHELLLAKHSPENRRNRRPSA